MSRFDFALIMAAAAITATSNLSPREGVRRAGGLGLSERGILADLPHLLAELLIPIEELNDRELEAHLIAGRLRPQLARKSAARASGAIVAPHEGSPAAVRSAAEQLAVTRAREHGIDRTAIAAQLAGG